MACGEGGTGPAGVGVGVTAAGTVPACTTCAVSSAVARAASACAEGGGAVVVAAGPPEGADAGAGVVGIAATAVAGAT